MRKLLETAIVFALIVVLTAVIAARFSGARRTAQLIAMRGELRNLVTAQEIFYQMTSDSRAGSRYAETLEQLAFVPEEDIKIEMRAGPSGWASRAESTKLDPGEYFCSVFVGDADPYPPAQTEGAVACEPERLLRETG
jgi:type II secretory pathway pseudopilin PulG